jgi:hypothetical protein
MDSIYAIEDCNQMSRIDLNKMYLPMLKYNSVRMVLAIIKYDIEMKQFKIKTTL